MGIVNGADLTTRDLSNLDLSGCVFVECNFEGADFQRAILEGAVFAGCTLNRASFARARARGVWIIGCEARHTDWFKADLSLAVAALHNNNIQLLRKKLAEGTPNKPNEALQELLNNGVVSTDSPESLIEKPEGMLQSHKSSQDLFWTDFADSSFERTDLELALLAHAKFEDCNFTSARLVNACFWSADLSRCRFEDAAFRPNGEKNHNCPRDSLDFSPLGLFCLGCSDCNFRFGRVNLSEADLRGTDLRELQFHEAWLDDADLRRANISGCTFEGCKIRSANLEEVTGQKAVFSDVWLHGSVVRSANLQEVNADTDPKRCLAPGVDARGASFQGAKLQGWDLTAAMLEAADLEDACLEDAILHGAYLRRAILKGAVLRGTKAEAITVDEAAISDETQLCGIDWPGASLRGVVFPKDTKLSKANLQDANLFAAQFQAGCSLEGVELNGCNLAAAKLGVEDGGALNGEPQQVKLTGCRLQNADLSRTVFRNVSLQNCCLERADISSAEWQKVEIGGGGDEGGHEEMGWVRFSESTLGQVHFKNVSLRNAYFYRALLKDTRFENCDLTATDFSHATLEKTDFDFDSAKNNLSGVFVGTVFDSVAVSGGTWQGVREGRPSVLAATFERASLKNVTFRDLLFQSCDFGAAILEPEVDNCDFTDSRFVGCDLSGVTASCSSGGEREPLIFVGCDFQRSTLRKSSGNKGAAPPEATSGSGQSVKMVLYDCKVAGGDPVPAKVKTEELPALLHCELGPLRFHGWKLDGGAGGRPLWSGRGILRKGLSRLLKSPRPGKGKPREDLSRFEVPIQKAVEDSAVQKRVKELLEHQGHVIEDNMVEHMLAPDVTLAFLWKQMARNFAAVARDELVSRCLIRHRFHDDLARRRRGADAPHQFVRAALPDPERVYVSNILLLILGALVVLLAELLAKLFQVEPARAPWWFCGALVVGLLSWLSWRRWGEVLSLSHRVYQYGESWRLILYNAGAVIFTFALLYWANGLCDLGALTTNDRLIAPRGSGVYFLKALYFSVVTFTTLGFGDIQPRGYNMVLAATEALLGAISMALFVYTFARRTAER